MPEEPWAKGATTRHSGEDLENPTDKARIPVFCCVVRLAFPHAQLLTYVYRRVKGVRELLPRQRPPCGSIDHYPIFKAHGLGR